LCKAACLTWIAWLLLPKISATILCSSARWWICRPGRMAHR
jgi:hypothetical protein